jgi:hypothetical protein
MNIDIIDQIRSVLAKYQEILENDLLQTLRNAAEEIIRLRKSVKLGLKEGTVMRVRFDASRDGDFLAECLRNHLIDKAEMNTIGTRVDVIIRIAAPGIDRVLTCIQKYEGEIINIGGS